MSTIESVTNFDVIILGSGPAGLSASIYTSRARLNTLIISGYKWGGQLQQTTLVENYPGFVDGIQGPELMTNMRKQAERFGVKFVDEDADKVELVSGGGQKVYTASGEYVSRAVIIATGAEFKWLGLPSEQRLIGRGVSACATCDAAFFKDKKVVVVGGGDSAMEEALVLSKHASEVLIVHRRDSFRASKAMQDRVFGEAKIKTMMNCEVVEVLGEARVEGVMVRKTDGEKTLDSVIDCGGLFVAIGHTPASKLFEGLIDMDEKKYLKRSGVQYKTMSNLEGVFVAGDVHDHVYRQAITAAGYGVEAALDSERWLVQ